VQPPFGNLRRTQTKCLFSLAGVLRGLLESQTRRSLPGQHGPDGEEHGSRESER
jgi:hypothetical protein